MCLSKGYSLGILHLSSSHWERFDSWFAVLSSLFYVMDKLDLSRELFSSAASIKVEAQKVTAFRQKSRENDFKSLCALIQKSSDLSNPSRKQERWQTKSELHTTSFRSRYCFRDNAKENIKETTSVWVLFPKVRFQEQLWSSHCWKSFTWLPELLGFTN